MDIVDNIKIDTVESNLTELKRCVLYKIDIYPAGADAADGTFCIRVQPKAASDALVENGATRAGVFSVRVTPGNRTDVWPLLN